MLVNGACNLVELAQIKDLDNLNWSMVSMGLLPHWS